MSVIIERLKMTPKRPSSANNLVPEVNLPVPASPRKKNGVKIGFGEDEVKGGARKMNVFFVQQVKFSYRK